MWAKKLDTKPSSIDLLLNCNLLCVSKTPSYLICAILGVFCVSIFTSCLYKPQNDTLQVNQIMLLLSLKPLNSMLMNRREENQMPSRDLQSFITSGLYCLSYFTHWPDHHVSTLAWMLLRASILLVHHAIFLLRF